MAVIKILDGPMAGEIHEVHKGFTPPEKFGSRAHGKTGMHWYIVSEDKKTARFSHTNEDDRVYIDPDIRIAELENEVKRLKEGK